MVESASRIGLSHFSLQITAENLADHCIILPEMSGIAPSVILCRTKIHFVEFRSSFIVEERKFQFTISVFTSEKQAKSVFGVFTMTAPSAANSKSAIDLKSFLPVRIDEFNRNRTLPCLAIHHRVHINAAIHIE